MEHVMVVDPADLAHVSVSPLLLDEPTQLDNFDVLAGASQESQLEAKNIPPLSGVTIDDIFSESEDEKDDQNYGTASEHKSVAVGSISDESSSDGEEHEGTNDSLSSAPGSPASVKSLTMELSADERGSSASEKKQEANRHRKDKRRKDKTVPPGDKRSEGPNQSSESVPTEAKTVAQSEVEVVKRLEQGPSDAELRRRALIEIDEDELEERIEFLNKAGLEAIAKATGVDKQERLFRLRTLRASLRAFVERDDKLSEEVEKQLDLHLRRVFPAGSDVQRNPWDYVTGDDLSDDEDAPPIPITSTAPPLPTAVQDDIIFLSDSEGDDDDSAPAPAPAPGAAVVTPFAAAAASPPPTKLVDLTKRVPFFDPKLLPKSDRSALLSSLRQRVHVHAKDNYCQQRKIRAQDLAVQMEISEKCRQLLVLLKEKWDDRTLKERTERRVAYFQNADADEEEFDEHANLGEGQFLSEAEKALLLRKMQGELDETDDEEEQENDDSITSAGEEVGEAADDPEECDADGDEEGVASDEEAAQPKADPVQLLRKVFGRAGRTAARQEEEDDDADDEERMAVASEDDEAPALTKTRKSRRPLDDGDIVESAWPTASIAETDPPFSTTGDLSVTNVDADAVDGEQSSPSAAMADTDADAQSVTATVKTAKSKRVHTGNAMYRLALEEDERRARGQRRSRLVEDEAEEEEEEGAQAGMGDFGFVLNKEDDEKRALALRKGDLDHIVDELSSDEEEDNEEARRRRMEMEEQRDQEMTRKVITAVTEGHDKVHQKKGYSFDALVRGRSARDKAAGEDPKAEEFDEEELLQRGLESKLERIRTAQAYAPSDSDSDESSVHSDAEEEVLATTLDGEEAEQDEETARLREVERARRKQMEKQFKIQRELRRMRAFQSQGTVVAGGAADAVPQAAAPAAFVSSTFTAMAGPAHRRLSVKTLRQITAHSQQPASLASSMQPPPLQRQLSSSSIGGGSNSGARVRTPKSSMYKGELSKMEMEGLGMGMAMNGVGIYSLVTGGAAGGAGVGVKRSFAGALLQADGSSAGGAKRPSGLKRGVSMAGPSFVFTEASNLSRQTSAHAASVSQQGTQQCSVPLREQGASGMAAGGSLFEKLKRTHSMTK